MGDKVVSPCIDVCKFKRDDRCIGCGMRKKDKKHFKKLDGKKEKRAFLNDLVALQEKLGKYRHWLPAYRRKCLKKGVDPTV